ncbi:MAG: CBS domain-containing protein [Campylobacterota bacterium]|nr:CBS domain-containing protein [Campylobacterota bacterium]
MFLKDFIVPTDDAVGKTAKLQEVIDKMTDKRLHHIVIVDDNKPIGIITERDIVRFFSNHIDFNSLALDHATKEIITLHHTRLVEYAVGMMLHNNIRKIIVTNNNDEYIGCIEQEDLIYCMEDKIHEKELKLHQLTHIGNKAVLVNESSTLKYALEIMITNKLTSLLVTSNKKAIGIISESDIIRLAKKNIDQNEQVKYFMHAPIIQIEEYKTAEDMVSLMRKSRIRRVVVFNSKDDLYYILTSKDIASIIQGNYTKFIESKFVDSRDTFNALSEYVIELIDIDEAQVIFWINSITKANFNIKLDDDITKLIPKDIWKPLLIKLLESRILFETIEISGRFYQIKGHYGSMTDDKVIKLFLNDVTEIMKLTEQLKKENELKDKLLYDQAKMAQMGEMIGNIAHQWRQPLSIITTSASGLQLKKEYDMLDDEFLNNTLEEIQNSAQYLSSTIDTFREFIKEKKVYKEVILQERINTAVQIVNTTLKNNYIELINCIYEQEPIKIKLVLGELSQVIINIVNNAKDAIIHNGIKKPWIKIDLEKLEGNVILTIEDNGGGIPADVFPHIFKPYFTTKDKTQGTGLGLDMSYKIITESLKGKLYADNTENGVKFFIELPL